MEAFLATEQVMSSCRHCAKIWRMIARFCFAVLGASSIIGARTL